MKVTDGAGMITFDHVSFRYPAASRAALDAVSTTFEPGSVTVLTGALGAGCSTLLLAAAGLAPHLTGGHLTGSVSVLGFEPSTPEGRRVLAGRVGLLLPTPWTQVSGMALTVADEIAFGPANHGWPRGVITDAVARAMNRLAVSHLADRDPGTLSGGELQRVMLAALIAMEPDVYLLDEPALELDPAGADALNQLLPELAQNAIVIVAAADVDRLVEIADRVLLLQVGRCLADGSPHDVLGSAQALRERATTTIAEIAAAAGVDAPYPLTVSAAVTRLGR